MELHEVYLNHIGWFTHEAGDDVARFLSEGWFEYREQAFLWLYLRENDLFLDCGAHIGLFSVLAGRILGAGGSILSVEPHPGSLELLERNLQANGVPNARVVGSAVAATDVAMALIPGGPGKSAYSSVVAPLGSRAEIPVHGVTLDSLLRDETREVTIAKIDVEGAELKVLAGASAAIRSGRLPLLLIECTGENLQRFGTDTKALFDTLGGLGYRVCRFDTNTWQLADYSYTGSIGYENLFAAQNVDQVNARLRNASESARRIARDIVQRGSASERLHNHSETASSALAEAARLRECAEAAYKAKGEALWLAEEANKRAARSEERAASMDAAARLSANEALESRRKADYFRRLAEQNHAYAESCSLAVVANREQAEDQYRRAEEFQALCSELQNRLTQTLRSKSLRWAWSSGVAKKPGWVDEEINTAPIRDLPCPTLLDIPEPPAPLLEEPSRTESTGPEPAAAPIPDNESGTQHVETEMMRALRHLAEKQFQPTAILDVGAGKGYWSVLASSYFPQAQFHLLEPLAENEHALAMVAASNLQLHYTLVAAGNESGERTIQVAPEVDSSTMLFFPEADPALQRQVPIATIDELIDQNRIPLPDLVKIDVQCMELEVLKGAQRLFDHTEVFVIEVNLYEFLPNCPRVHEVMRYLEDRGYHLYDLAGSLRRPFEDDLGQLDLVMVSDKSFLTASKRWQ